MKRKGYSDYDQGTATATGVRTQRRAQERRQTHRRAKGDRGRDCDTQREREIETVTHGETKRQSERH